MSIRLFHQEDYLRINELTYNDFDEHSRLMLDVATSNINNKYQRNYSAKDAHGIQNDSSKNWFYIGFSENNTETNDGYKWYLITGGDYDSSDMTHIKGISCEEYYNYIESADVLNEDAVEN